MGKRILFLDFDGVLHDADAPNIEYEDKKIKVTGEGLFKHATTLAAALADYPDVDVVISSSWRNHFPLPELVERLGVLGERVTDTICQVNMQPRGRYFDCATYAKRQEVDDWLMIDDQPEIVFGAIRYPIPALRVCLLVCDPVQALDTFGVLPRLREWLAQPPEYTHGDFTIKHMMSCAQDSRVFYTIDWFGKTVTAIFMPGRQNKPFFSSAALESFASHLLETTGIDILTRDNEEWGPAHSSKWRTIVDMGDVRFRAQLIKKLVGQITIEMECIPAWVG